MIISKFIHLCLVAETAWSNPNVNFPRCCKYGNTSQLIEYTTRQSLTVFCPHFSSEIWLHTYIHTYQLYSVYLTTHKIMMNFGALNWFDSFFWQKTLDCINHMIYTFDNVQLPVLGLIEAIFREATSAKLPGWITIFISKLYKHVYVHIIDKK